VDPFGGIVADGNIYRRGAEDMKSLTVEQLLAIRNLKAHGFNPTRTIHVGFFPGVN